MKPLVLLFALFFAVPAQAGPKHWLATHKRFLAMESAAIAGASIHAAGLHHCRHFGVEHCDEHYGAAWAYFGIVSGMTVIAMPAVAEGCWKANQGKFCYLFAYGGSLAQTGHGIYEWRVRAPKVDTDSSTLRFKP